MRRDLLGFVRVALFVPLMVLLVVYTIVAAIGMVCIAFSDDICRLYGWRFPVQFVARSEVPA